MTYTFKITRAMLHTIHVDLSRKHCHALERVGFIVSRSAQLPSGQMLLAEEYMPVADEDYVIQQRFGAMISAAAFRKAMQRAYSSEVSIFHVHRHEHKGTPRFSRDDLIESAKFIPDFWNVRPGVPHGTILLSQDAAIGNLWEPKSREAVAINEISVIGFPTQVFRN